MAIRKHESVSLNQRQMEAPSGLSGLRPVPFPPPAQTIKTNLSRDNDFMKESVIQLADQMKRYENYSDIMISIKKEISNLGYQLLQKDAAAVPESRAQVPSCSPHHAQAWSPLPVAASRRAGHWSRCGCPLGECRPGGAAALLPGDRLAAHSGRQALSGTVMAAAPGLND